MAKSARWTTKEVESIQKDLKGLKSPVIKEKKAKGKPPIVRTPIDYKKYEYVIGVDTGVNTGFAVWSIDEKKLIDVKTYKIHEALHRLRLARYDSIFVRVEDARLRTYIPRQRNERAERGRAQGAGSVKRDAMIFEDFLVDNEINFELIAPKDNKTKINAEYFKQLTGWQERCSQHARDASMLVFGY